MRTARIRDVSRSRGYVITTSPDKRQLNAPDLVKRQFGANMTADLVVSGKRCAQMGVGPSIGAVGDVHHNVMAESFFSAPECELIELRACNMHTGARLPIFTSTESGYNPHRCHLSLNYPQCAMPLWVTLPTYPNYHDV